VAENERPGNEASQEAEGGGECAPPAESPADVAAEKSLDRQFEALHAELEEANDRALRIQAELENYRKRTARELQAERRYASLPLLRDLLPVWDNVRRAIESAEKQHDTASLLEGVRMVAQQFENVLQGCGCRRIESLDRPFDPNLHEAVCQRPSAACPPGTVIAETLPGFLLHDRVVRPSQVIVSTEGPSRNPEER
jgi:molecular chaperone GrpE